MLGCPKCVQARGSSDGEESLYNVLLEAYPSFNFIKNSRDLLSDGKEIDIFIEGKNIGIEFNGLYWHCDECKPKLYHYEKYVTAKDSGIQLFQIFQDEFMFRKKAILEMLNTEINEKNDKLISNAQVITLTDNEINEWNKKHLINDNIFKIGKNIKNFAVIDNGNIVAVMSINQNNDSYFISNYTSTIQNVEIFKILENAAMEYLKISNILFYIDLRYPIDVEKYNFTLKEYLPPRDHYFDQNKTPMQINDSLKDDFEKVHNIKRIWDSGIAIYQN